VGVLIALAIPTAMSAMKMGDLVAGVRAMGWFIVIALPATLLVNLLFVPEPAPQEGRPHGGFKAYVALFKRPTVRKILLCDLYLGIAPGLTGALLYFYFSAVKGFAEGQSNLFMVLYFIAGLVGAPLWGWLASKLGKDRALQIASIAFAALYAGMGFLPAGNFPITAVGMFLVGIPYAAGLQLTRAMMADVADEVRLDTGEDRMGLLFSFLSLTTKFGYAISVGSLILLGWAGFNKAPGAINTGTALIVLQVMFLAVPAVLLVLSALTLNRYPLNAKRHAEVRAALEARAAEG
jgi:Na+/melibiose symporter-like transporter